MKNIYFCQHCHWYNGLIQTYASQSIYEVVLHPLIEIYWVFFRKSESAAMSAEQKGDKHLIWSMTSQKFMKLTQNGVELSGTGNEESSK